MWVNDGISLGDFIFVLATIFAFVVIAAFYLPIITLPFNRNAWSRYPLKTACYIFLVYGMGCFGGYLFIKGGLPWYIPAIGISAVWWNVFDGIFDEIAREKEQTSNDPYKDLSETKTKHHKTIEKLIPTSDDKICESCGTILEKSYIKRHPDANLCKDCKMLDEIREKYNK